MSALEIGLLMFFSFPWLISWKPYFFLTFLLLTLTLIRILFEKFYLWNDSVFQSARPSVYLFSSYQFTNFVPPLLLMLTSQPATQMPWKQSQSNCFSLNVAPFVYSIYASWLMAIHDFAVSPWSFRRHKVESCIKGSQGTNNASLLKGFKIEMSAKNWIVWSDQLTLFFAWKIICDSFVLKYFEAYVHLFW